MTFVNEPFMYSFGLWCLSIGTAFLMFGNLRFFDGTPLEKIAKKHASYTSSYRWIILLALQLMIIAPAGMYLMENSQALDTADDGLEDTAAFINRRYQQKRNALMYFKYVLAFGTLLATQAYKHTSTNAVAKRLEDAPFSTSTEVQGYEQMSFHFLPTVGHYFSNQEALAWLSFVYIALEFTTMFLVVTHQSLFSNKGLATT